MDEQDKIYTDEYTPSPHENNPENNTQSELHQQDNQPPQHPHYDSFMYEPIGFEERSNPATIQINEAKEKKRRMRHDTTIVVLFFILVLITLIIGIYGIFSDIYHSSDRLESLSGNQNVVIFQNSKPSGANNLDNFIDENGKYTTEGVAAAVQESIVEIYAYKDAFRQNLVGTGSGVVLTKDGYIVTNAHVLQADGYHDIRTTNNKVFPAKIIGRDSKTDIAVLKVTSSDLIPAILGDSDEVMVGESVIAVGNPAGLSNTVTNGIVSAINRKVKSDSTGFEMNCIQTNADISPGNSGGALVNMYGQVIGITSSKYASTFYEGLGFAITINEAKPIIEELINNGFISGRFRIGITLIGMDEPSNIYAIENELGYELPEDFSGVYINDISEDCDIANTDLKAGDFITKINGIPVKTYNELYDAISSSYGAGDKVPATCAHVDENGEIEEYEIEFMLMEDTSGNY